MSEIYTNQNPTGSDVDDGDPVGVAIVESVEKGAPDGGGGATPCSSRAVFRILKGPWESTCQRTE